MSEIRSQATPARDELAGEIGLEIMEVVVDLTGGYKPDGERDHNRIEKGARAILALLKPRTVNSIEEALTLPEGTVIRPGPIVWPRSGEISVNISDQRHYVHWTGSDCPDELATWMLPFAVLFAPGDAG